MLIGSSGGGTATLGHTEPAEFIQTIVNELKKIDGAIVSLDEVVFVSLDNGKGMDSSDEKDPASRFHLSGEMHHIYRGSLKEINCRVLELDTRISKDIQDGKFEGLISVSCKPALFAKTLNAAAARELPLTGTGGTSLSAISSTYGVKLVGNAGGSVATTPLTKAISFTHALAQTLSLSYRPWTIGSSKNLPTWRSVLNSSLPAFWGVMLCKRLLIQWRAEDWLPNATLLIDILESYALPIVCAVAMANSRRSSPGVVMGAVIAGSACHKTVLGGLLAGWFVSLFEERLLYLCILYGNLPATMTNLLTTGFVGVIVAGFMTPLGPYLASATELMRGCIAVLLEPCDDEQVHEALRLATLSMIGSVFCYGSKVGWYHSIYLPVILIEMEVGDAAVFGCIDQLTLVLVGAGICSATLFWAVASGKMEDRSLVTRGLLINLLCGDFIEVCYPIMEQDPIVNFGGYLASACSTCILSIDCKSSAYLPVPIALWLADDWELTILAFSVAFGISFLSTLASAILTTMRSHRTKND